MGTIWPQGKLLKKLLAHMSVHAPLVKGNICIICGIVDAHADLAFLSSSVITGFRYCFLGRSLMPYLS